MKHHNFEYDPLVSSTIVGEARDAHSQGSMLGTGADVEIIAKENPYAVLVAIPSTEPRMIRQLIQILDHSRCRSKHCLGFVKSWMVPSL
jgi:hypothetical protein